MATLCFTNPVPRVTAFYVLHSHYLAMSDSLAPQLLLCSTFLYLATRLEWVISFTSLPLYSRGKVPLYALDKRLGGPLSRSRTPWRREKSCTMSILSFGIILEISELRTTFYPGWILPRIQIGENMSGAAQQSAQQSPILTGDEVGWVPVVPERWEG